MTKETMPFHVWQHELQLMAIAQGATSRSIDSVKSKFRLWWATGETLDSALVSLMAFALGFETAFHFGGDQRLVEGRKIVECDNGTCRHAICPALEGKETSPPVRTIAND